MKVAIGDVEGGCMSSHERTASDCSRDMRVCVYGLDVEKGQGEKEGG